MEYGGNGVVFIVVWMLTGKDADLLHDGFQKPLGDLARRKRDISALIMVWTSWPRGKHRMPALRNDFGCVLEDEVGVLIEGGDGVALTRQISF